MENLRPHGTIKAWKTGHAFFTENIRDELGIKEDARIPYYLNSKTILLTRRKMTLRELLAELETLKSIVIRRGGEIQQNSGDKRAGGKGGTGKK